MLSFQRNLDRGTSWAAAHLWLEDRLVMRQPVSKPMERNHLLFDRKSPFLWSFAWDIRERPVQRRRPERLLVTACQDVSPEPERQLGDYTIDTNTRTTSLFLRPIKFPVRSIVPPVMLDPALVFEPLPHDRGMVRSNVVTQGPMDVVTQDYFEVAEVDQQSASYLAGPVVQLNSPVTVAGARLNVTSEPRAADKVFELVCWRGH